MEKKRIGIFFGYQPGVVLGSEGLGRYIGNLIKGFIDNGNHVTIACPKWMIRSLLELFDEFQIPEDSIKFISSQKVPVLWSIYEYLQKRKNRDRRSRRVRFLIGCKNVLEWGVGILLRITSFAIFFLLALFAALLALACLPLVAVLFLLFAVGYCIAALRNKGKNGFTSLFRRIKTLMESLSVRGISVELFLLERMQQNVIEELIRKINRSDECIWYVPAVFWPQVNRIKRPTVINAPDLVTTEFPLGFARFGEGTAVTKRCSATIENGRYFITYCEYLRNELIIKQFGKPSEHVIAIPHADNSMKSYLALSAGGESDTLSLAREILADVAQYSPDGPVREYLKGVPVGELRYIFYASQVRPHKNVLTLIKAYEYLLRRKYVGVKLVLTGNLGVIPEIQDYINSHRLQYDVLTFRGVPAQTLAALYKCASLVVNPSLYEGGFFFTFGEGMSVGTPSVMSRIPQVTYVTDRYDVESALFDPFDYKDIAAKIEYGLAHRNELYEIEYPLYHQEFEIRSNKVVAEDYLRAFDYFVRMDREEKLLEKA